MDNGEASCCKLSPRVIMAESQRAGLSVVLCGGLRFTVVAELLASSIRVMTAAMVN